MQKITFLCATEPILYTKVYTGCVNSAWKFDISVIAIDNFFQLPVNYEKKTHF